MMGAKPAIPRVTMLRTLSANDVIAQLRPARVTSPVRLADDRRLGTTAGTECSASATLCEYRSLVPSSGIASDTGRYAALSASASRDESFVRWICGDGKPRATKSLRTL